MCQIWISPVYPPLVWQLCALVQLDIGLSITTQVDLTGEWLECGFTKVSQFHQNQIYLGRSFTGSSFLLRPNLGQPRYSVVVWPTLSLNPSGIKWSKSDTWIASSKVVVPRSNVGRVDRVLFPVQSLPGLPARLLSALQLPLWLTLPCQWPHPHCSTLSALTLLSLSLFLWLAHNQGCARSQDGPWLGQMLPG